MNIFQIHPVAVWLSSALPIMASDGGWALSIQILIGVVMLQAGIIYLLYRHIRNLQERVEIATTASGFDESPASLNPLFSKALTGSLERFSMSEVIQFLNSIRETGILDIVDPDLAEVHRLIVKEGEIVDAFNGDLKGEAAAKAILHCRRGSFTFIRGEVPDEERRIHTPAMTLLMEACQESDERQFELAQAS